MKIKKHYGYGYSEYERSKAMKRLIDEIGYVGNFMGGVLAGLTDEIEDIMSEFDKVETIEDLLKATDMVKEFMDMIVKLCSDMEDEQ